MVEKSAIRVLVLDDEPFMLKLLSHMLATQGFTLVMTCDSALTALKWVDHPQTLPDLILCDLNMPGMDGIEFIRMLVAHRYTGSLILMSGEDERLLKTVEILVKAHQIMVLGCLHKPITPEGLTAMLEKWMPSSQAQPRVGKKAYGAEELRSAIANHGLVNFYQPKVAVATGKVVGVETLVRWHHPLDGLVLPDQFIGLAEAHGLIDDLSRVVLKKALVHAKVWQEAGLALRVAINVSMDNFSSLDFVDFIAGIAAEVGVPPQGVVLEVTESRLMGDRRAPLEALARLRLKHFHLSIDDFGTGHSSLTQLRNIPFDELKIDQSFVHGAWMDETLRAIYDASLSLANQLGMEVVAEGVEDQEDWDFLRRTGCHLAQGYFIARPMPAADLFGWIETWNDQHGDGPT
jgi:EAL domain-containing protein (putative c-di-GMP-specific phosphodiesterase class I)/CheY-like chemotaxis protein